MNSIQYFWLGRQPYSPIWELQKELHSRRVSGTINDVVLFVDSSLYGGIESHLVELAKLLHRKGVTCKVLFYQDHNNQLFYNKLESANIQFEFLQGSFSSLKSAFTQFSKHTVIHTHGYKAGICGRLLCHYLGLRCVSTYHAGEPGFGMVRLYNALDKLTARFSINFAVSKKIKNQNK